MTDLGTHTLDSAYEMFMLDCESRRLTSSTRQFYRSKLVIFIRWCGERGEYAVGDVSTHSLRQFFVGLLRRNLSGQYQHNHARAIRAFLNFCVRDELIERSPFAKVQMPKIEKKVLSALEAGDVHALLKHAINERDRALCLFLLDSGVRASELVALNVGHVDLGTGVVLVERGKGQKGRTTYIGATTRKYLLRYLRRRKDTRPDRPLFASANTGERLTVCGLVQLMERLRKRAGLKECSCHTFRRTFALNCLRNGMNIYVLARLMGHADIAILRQYLPLVENDLWEAHARFGAVDNFLR